VLIESAAAPPTEIVLDLNATDIPMYAISGSASSMVQRQVQLSAAIYSFLGDTSQMPFLT
jgi:hypothetical protein